MTLRGALEDVLGAPLVAGLVASLGPEWAVLAAYSRVEQVGAWSDGARALAAWPERQALAWDRVSLPTP